MDQLLASTQAVPDLREKSRFCANFCAYWFNLQPIDNKRLIRIVWSSQAFFEEINAYLARMAGADSTGLVK
jgi:hypothetical protein